MSNKLEKGKSGNKFGWSSDTIDNEHLGHRSSKCCFVYEKQHAFGESIELDPQKVKKNMKTTVMYSVLGVIKREDTAIFQAAWLILHLQNLKTHLNPFLPLSLTKASFCFSHSLTRLNCMQDVLVATQELNVV